MAALADDGSVAWRVGPTGVASEGVPGVAVNVGSANAAADLHAMDGNRRAANARSARNGAPRFALDSAMPGFFSRGLPCRSALPVQRESVAAPALGRHPYRGILVLSG